MYGLYKQNQTKTTVLNCCAVNLGLNAKPLRWKHIKVLTFRSLQIQKKALHSLYYVELKTRLK